MTAAAIRSLIVAPSLACLAFSGAAFSGHASSGHSARQSSSSSEVKVHEWGTFTSIADRTGRAVKWRPLNGSTDLPGFVKHFRTAEFKVGLLGTVRMETPVLYFYSPAESTVSVKVGFSKGVITEWYPQASHIEPDPHSVLDGAVLYQNGADGSIEWNSVTISPNLIVSLPHDPGNRQNHYYTARETSSAPLVVRTREGTQQEKFLFYRGVSVFPIPVAAEARPDGRVLLKNLGQDEIPGVVLFERRGNKLGYRLGGALSGTPQSEMLLDPPELTSTIESMSRDLEDILMSQGLYADEAHAMVETWRLSWFEEGSRLLYIVPANFVNAVLPLRISPAPPQTVRVFVGRLELITPATERTVETALAAHDLRTVRMYGRFLEPILEKLKAKDPAHAQQLDKELTETYSGPASSQAK